MAGRSMAGMPEATPPAWIFRSAHFAARELGPADLPRLQSFIDHNPEYWLGLSGRPPAPDAAQVEFDEMPPARLGHARRWFAGVFDGGGALVGAVVFVSDLMAPGVWHVAWFIVATRLHGSGAAAEIFAAFEGFVRSHGASWLRLGVVDGNARAERFWARLGFVEVRRRHDVDTGQARNTVRVLVKALAQGELEAYLARVPRDRPDSPPP